jgi:hypothetical protein
MSICQPLTLEMALEMMHEMPVPPFPVISVTASIPPHPGRAYSICVAEYVNKLFRSTTARSEEMFNDDPDDSYYFQDLFVSSLKGEDSKVGSNCSRRSHRSDNSRRSRGFNSSREMSAASSNEKALG